MSRTTLYVFDCDGVQSTLAEFRNGWRSAPMFWDYLLAKLGHPTGMQYWSILWGADPASRSFLNMLEDEPKSDAEKATKTKRCDAIEAGLTEAEWWVFTTTMDRHVVSAECADHLAVAFREMQQRIEGYQTGQNKLAPSFSEQAEIILRETDVEPATTGLRGFAWNQTSVSNTWSWIEEEDDEERAPRLSDGGYHLVTGLRQVEYVKEGENK